MTCAEPGCTGTVVDGYCDVCGTAPPAPGSTPAAPPVQSKATAASRPTARSKGTARTGSSRSSSTRGRLGAGVVTIPRIPKGTRPQPS